MIRKEAGYGGARVLIDGELANARCKTQIDIGFGDAVTPEPLHAIYPVLLAALPAPALRTYPVYTVIAVKLHAIALLGMANMRLKDYLDLAALFERESLDPHILLSALQATFKRRGMDFPAPLPIGLTSKFSDDRPAKPCGAHSSENELPDSSLPAVVATLAARIEPLLGSL
jgi:hypothetical protein